MEEKRKHAGTFSGIVWTALGSGGQSVFLLLVFVVLARTLTPSDFGVVAIAGSLIDILSMIGRFGLVEYLIRFGEDDDDDLSTGFWLSLAIGVTLTLLVASLSGPISNFFSAPELSSVIILLAPTCVIYAAGAVYEAKLRKESRFKSLAARNVGSVLVSGAISLIFAVSGFGALSLVMQRLSFSIINLTSMIWFLRWCPRRRVDFSVAALQLRNGGMITISSLLGLGNQRVFDLMVGYYLGPTSLGYFRIAWRIIELMLEICVRPIGSVTLTALAKFKGDGEKLKSMYLAIVWHSSMFILPVFLGASALSPLVIPLVFGEHWSESAELLQAISLMAFFVPLVYFKNNLLMASEKYDVILKMNLVEFVVGALLVYLACQMGQLAVALTTPLRLLIITPIVIIYFKKIFGIIIYDQLYSVLPFACAGSVMYAALIIISHFFFNQSSLCIAITLIIAGVGVYLAMAYVLSPNFRQLIRKILYQ